MVDVTTRCHSRSAFPRRFVGTDNKETPLANVSVVLGNVVLADHGLTMPAQDLGIVPAPSLFYAPDPSAGYCAPPVRAPLPVRFLPQTREPAADAGRATAAHRKSIDTERDAVVGDFADESEGQQRISRDPGGRRQPGDLAAVFRRVGDARFILGRVRSRRRVQPSARRTGGNERTGDPRAVHRDESDQRIAGLCGDAAGKLALHQCGLTANRTGAGNLSCERCAIAQHGRPESGRRKRHRIPGRPADESVGVATAVQRRVAAADRSIPRCSTCCCSTLRHPVHPA